MHLWNLVNFMGGGEISEFFRMPHPGQVPWFVPMVSDPNAPWCMRFWFHMFGPLVGALRVLIRVHNMTTPSLHQVWALSSSAGNAWFMAHVTVSSIHDFQVRHWPCQVWLKAFRQLLRSRSVRCMKYNVWCDVLKTFRPIFPTYEIWEFDSVVKLYSSHLGYQIL